MKTKWTKDLLVKFEADLAKDFKAGLINCPLHLCGGNEDILIDMFDSIKSEDWVVSTHRSHYHYLLKGGDEQGLLDEIYGKVTGICGGCGRSMHVMDLKVNFISSAIVAGGCAIATGIALGLKKDASPSKNIATHKSKPMVWCFVGDGAEDSGHFYEAVRFSLGRDLPITFVIEDNDNAVDSTKADRWKKYLPFEAPNIIRYKYERTYPHVGIGEHVSF